MMKPTAAPIIRRWGFRTVLVGNGVISAGILMLYALFRPSTPYVLIILTLFIGGFFRSLQFTCLSTLTYADVTPQMMSNASTFASRPLGTPAEFRGRDRPTCSQHEGI